MLYSDALNKQQQQYQWRSNYQCEQNKLLPFLLGTKVTRFSKNREIGSPKVQGKEQDDNF